MRGLDPFQHRRAGALQRQIGGNHKYSWFVGFILDVGTFSERCARTFGISLAAMDLALARQIHRQEQWDEFAEASEPNEQIGDWMKQTFGA